MSPDCVIVFYTISQILCVIELVAIYDLLEDRHINDITVNFHFFVV